MSTTVNSSTSAQLLVAADGSRTSLTIQNTDANELFIGPDNTVSTTNYQYRRVYGTGYTFSGVDAQQAYYGVWDVDGSGGAVITEITTPVSDGNGAGIETYAELKAAIAAWLRPNSAVTADMTTNIPRYVGMAEVMIRRELHLRVQDVVDTLTITSGTAPVPTGFMAVTSMTLTQSPYTLLTGKPLEYVRASAQNSTAVTPEFYARSGSLFYFDFTGDAEAEIAYRTGLTPLSNDGDTNWILAAHPDVYLYGSLLQADRRLIGPRLGEWKEGFAQALESIKALEMKLHTDVIRPMPSGFPV